MANPHKGEVTLNDGDASYTLVYSTNALCEIEQATGKAIGESMADIERLSTLRLVFWAGLIERWPGASIKDAGFLIDRIGVPAVMKAILEAITLAFPKSDSKAPAKNPR